MGSSGTQNTKRKEENKIGNEEQVACAEFQEILADGGQPVYLYQMDPLHGEDTLRRSRPQSDLRA